MPLPPDDLPEITSDDHRFAHAANYAEGNLYPFEDLILQGIELKSPGWISVVGKLNPLRWIQGLVVAIRDWSTTRERNAITNYEALIKATDHHAKLMKSLGFSPKEIRKVTREVLLPAVKRLTQYVKQGRITAAQIEEIVVGMEEVAEKKKREQEGKQTPEKSKRLKEY